MKKKFQVLQGTLVIILIALFFSACNSTSNTSLKYVPKDAFFVASFNLQQMQDKLQYGDIHMDSLISKINAPDSAFPLFSYLDAKKQVLAYVQSSSAVMAEEEMSYGLIGELADKAGFEKRLAMRNPDKAIENKDGYNLLSIDDESCLVWDHKTVILYGGQDIVQQIPSRFFMERKASLASDKNAVAYLTKQADIHVFTSSQNGVSRIPMLSMTKLSDLIKDNYGGFSLNFEKGQIVIDGEYSYNKIVEGLIKKHPTKNLNRNLLAHYPGKPMSLIQVSFNLKQILSLLDYAGITHWADSYLTDLDFTTQDLTKALSGDVGLAMQSLTDSSTNSFSPKLLIVAAIGDKGSFDKIMAGLEKIDITEQHEGQWFPKGLADDERWSFYTDNRSLVYGTDKQLMEDYQSGSKKIIYPEGLDYSGNVSVGYWDFNSLLAEITSMEDASADSSILLTVLAAMDAVKFSTSIVEGHHATLHMQLELKDKSKNSLLAIVLLFQRISEMNRAGMTMMDSSAAVNAASTDDRIAK